MASKSSYVQVLDEGSLLVFFDERRYLVNCGEGLQRICAQHGVRLSRLGAVFLTRLDPWRDRVGGLPGMLSTLGDVSAAGVPLAPSSAPGDAPGGIQIVGPPHTAHCVGSLRAFLRRSSLALSVREYPLVAGGSSGPYVLYDDGLVNVRAVSVGERIVGSGLSAADACSRPLSKRPHAEVRPESYAPCKDNALPALPGDSPPPSGADGRGVAPDTPNGGAADTVCAARSHETAENCDIAVGATRNDFVVRMFKAEHTADDCPLRDAEGHDDEGQSADAEGHRDEDQKVDAEGHEHEGHLRDEVRMPPVAAAYRQALCLAIEGPALPGKFDALRARALGVAPGPLCGRLLRGESVEVTHNGALRTVRPEECVGPATPGATLVVLDVPAHAFWASPADVGRRIAALCAGRRTVLAVHLAPADVLASAEYRAHVLAALPGNAAHVLRPSATPGVPARVLLPSYAALARDLAAHGLDVCPSTRAPVVPPLHATEAESRVLSAFCGSSAAESLCAAVGQPLERWQWSPHYDALSYIGACDPNHSLRPKDTVNSAQLRDKDSIAHLRDNDDITIRQNDKDSITRQNDKDIISRPNDKESIEHSKDTGAYGPWDCPTGLYAPSRDAPALTFLGTGAAIPGKYRNVSATLLDYGDAALLLDCGEDTHRQLWRRFGAGTPAVVARLRAVLVSHLHADHQLGVPALLAAAPAGVVLVAPSRYRLFLEEYAECAGRSVLDRVRFVSCEDICGLSYDLVRGVFSAPFSEPIDDPIEPCISTDNAQAAESARCGQGTSSELFITAVPVIHCPLAFGFVINKDAPHSAAVVYSGDTRPCPALIAAGTGAHVLVHEATFEDALRDEAVARRHTTTDEAVHIARAMRVRALYMTHVSQRYAKSAVPVTVRADFPVVQAAVDLMTVHVCAEDASLRLVDAFSSLSL